MGDDERDDIIEEPEDEEPSENYPTLYIDGEPVGWYGAEVTIEPDSLERVQMEFSDAANGYQTEGQEARPLGWCNSAAITLDREDDAVHVSISVGDPRGAFVMTVRRLQDGRLIMHLPHPGEGMAHMPTKELHPGTLEIGS